jgi:drug/metabolite transporter (DMT)-like permease
MGESITPNLLIALGLVSLGMILANRKAPNRSSAEG